MNTFVVANPHKCIGCKACEIACAIAHLKSDIHTASVNETSFLPRVHLIRAPQVTMPIQCRQCEDAPCANVCPVNAITQEENCIVVHSERCIGCKTCMIACPFGAMDMALEEELQGVLQVIDGDSKMLKQNMVAQKCDLCIGRLGGPACVEICPGEAFLIVSQQVLEDDIKEKRVSRAIEMVRKRM